MNNNKLLQKALTQEKILATKNKGKEYDRIKPSYEIHVLNFVQYPDHKQKFQFREKTHPELVLTDDLSLHLFELPKLRKKDYVVSQQDNLNMIEWVRFLDQASQETEFGILVKLGSTPLESSF